MTGDSTGYGDLYPAASSQRGFASTDDEPPSLRSRGATPAQARKSDQTTRAPWRGALLALENLPLELVFLAIALTWGVLQVFIVPPFQVPDEGDHWFRAWALTDGQLTADKQGMVTLPASFTRPADLYTRLVAAGVLPVSLVGQAGFAGYEDLFNGTGPSGTVKVPSRVASYGPLGYLPQALGVALGRLLGAPPLTCFYLARLGNLLAAVALLFLAIRIAPFGKPLFLLLALLPMTMFELASVSCDALTIAGAMLFTALALRASARPTLRRTDIALLVSVAAVLLNIKPGYWALVLLVLLIRPAQLGGRLRFVLFVAGSILVVALIFLFVVLLTSTDARIQGGGGPQAQLLFIARQPLDFLGIVWSNLQANLVKWPLESIGVLGWFTIALPPLSYLLVLVGGFGALLQWREDVRLRARERALLAVVGAAVFGTMVVALYAFLEPTGSGQVQVQGRYLAPVLLLLLLSVYGIRFAPRPLGRFATVGVVLVVAAQNLQTLISVYHP